MSKVQNTNGNLLRGKSSCYDNNFSRYAFRYA